MRGNPLLCPDRVDMERLIPLWGKLKTRNHYLKIMGRPFKTDEAKSFISGCCESLELSASKGEGLNICKRVG